MIDKTYKKQVQLLLSVLPEVAKETTFALHGGTAINLFVRDMPRLSVDIDLTYLPIEDRPTTLANIAAGLEKIKVNLEKVLPGIRIQHKKEIGKLQISLNGVSVKLEANLVIRGTLTIPQKMILCSKAQKEFEAFCAINTVTYGQLYGGKICAALDRQHPRDLFDIKYFLANGGFNDEIKEGFFLCLLSSDRPIHEVISPNFQDQRLALVNQFTGMSNELFSYDEYEQVRLMLVNALHKSITAKDKEFLLSLKNLTPNWNTYDFERFPAIGWKLQNLQKLKDTNPEKYKKQFENLKEKLDGL